MLALGDRLYHAADVHAVLDDRIALAIVLQRELVADGNVVPRHDLDVLVVFHDPAGEMLARLHPFDDDDADAVALLVHHEMNHALPLEVGNYSNSHVHAPPVRAGLQCPPRRLRSHAAPLRERSVQARRRVRVSDAGWVRALDSLDGAPGSGA